MEKEERDYGFCQDCSWTWKASAIKAFRQCPNCGSYDINFHTEEEITNA